MALILTGPTVAVISGSIGGTVFARNRYGNYARNRTKPVDPGSNLQNTYRMRVSSAVAAWQDLTAAQRDLWNAKAQTTVLNNRIGQSFNPSGINLFIRTYNLLDIASITQVTTPPASPLLSSFTTTAHYWATNGFWIDSDHGDWPADTKLLVWYAFDKTKSTYFFKGPYSHFTTFVAADFNGGGTEIVTEGGLVADTSMFAMHRVVAPDGSASHVRRQRCFKPPA